MLSRKRIYEIIEKGQDDDKASIIFDWIIIGLIIASVIAIVIDSFKIENTVLLNCLSIIEYISIGVFTIEYLMRLFTADLKYPDKNKLVAVLAYVFSLIAIIDLLAILPFYLPRFIKVDLRFLRILRIAKILRLLKISRYNDSFGLIRQVFTSKKYELLTALFAASILLLLSSAIMYYIEGEAQPGAFPNILAAIWWGVATLTTVGYGDVYPITILGKILGGIIALLGVGIVALPTGIISSGFIESLQANRAKNAEFKCPHCGTVIRPE